MTCDMCHKWQLIHVSHLHYIIILYDFVVIKELLLRTYYIYELPTYNKQEDVVVYSDGYY